MLEEVLEPLGFGMCEGHCKIVLVTLANMSGKHWEIVLPPKVKHDVSTQKSILHDWRKHTQVVVLLNYMSTDRP